MKEKLLLNFSIALEAILANKVRSVLTALGIIFGVAAVIAMLAIGKGAEKEIMEQIKLVGVNNIVIKPVTPQQEEAVTEAPGKESLRKYSPGLTLKDVQAIQQVVPELTAVSPEVVLETAFVRSGLRRTGKLVGVNPSYFQLTDFSLMAGNMFSPAQIENGEPVCIIGHDIRVKFFNDGDPLGKYIKCGKNWLKVIGVLGERMIHEEARTNLGLRNFNMDVYTPLQTMRIRYVDRALVTKSMLEAAANQENNEEAEPAETDDNYHQLDRLVVQVKESALLQPTAEVISRLLQRRHYGVIDFEVEVPELMLKQEQENKKTFNILLGAIAGISLLVGGIGIMNIMLASVLERVKEIGLRLSLGARKSDIVQQFIFESVLISVTGGITGVIIGLLLSRLISVFMDIETVISAFSIILSFTVSMLTGLVFGITPARRAAAQDPISSLRYE